MNRAGAVALSPAIGIAVAGIGDEVLNALVDAVAAVNAGVAAATAREGFRLADASLAEECGVLCSPDVSGGR